MYTFYQQRETVLSQLSSVIPISQGTVVVYPVYRDCYGICIPPIHLKIQFLLSISTFNDFTVQHMSKLSCVANIFFNYHFWPKL